MDGSKVTHLLLAGTGGWVAVNWFGWLDGEGEAVDPMHFTAELGTQYGTPGLPGGGIITGPETSILAVRGLGA